MFPAWSLRFLRSSLWYFVLHKYITLIINAKGSIDNGNLQDGNFWQTKRWAFSHTVSHILGPKHPTQMQWSSRVAASEGVPLGWLSAQWSLPKEADRSRPDSQTNEPSFSKSSSPIQYLVAVTHSVICKSCICDNFQRSRLSSEQPWCGQNRGSRLPNGPTTPLGCLCFDRVLVHLLILHLTSDHSFSLWNSTRWEPSWWHFPLASRYESSSSESHTCESPIWVKLPSEPIDDDVSKENTKVRREILLDLSSLQLCRGWCSVLQLDFLLTHARLVRVF